MKCPACKKEQLRLKPTKAGTIFIACNGYPSCKNTMNMPRGISDLEKLNRDCSKCKEDKGISAKMFKLDF